MRRRLLLTAAGIATLPAWAASSPDLDTARTSAAAWLALVDAGDNRSSWAQAASRFKAAVTAAQWVQTANAVRAPLGAVSQRVESSAREAATLPGMPDGRYVVLQYQTRFEHKATAVETATLMLDADGGWKVAGYFIR